MDAVRPIIAGVLGGLGLGGCAAERPANPSFPLTMSTARAEMSVMRAEPHAAARPVVVVGGYADPGIAAPGLAGDLRDLIGADAVIVAVSPGFSATMQGARNTLIRRVEALPGGEADAQWTVEVDVVAVSMGGLVAAYAAMPREDGGRRLKIARLFTICTPYRGATMAAVPSLEPRVADMRKDSAFLARLEGSERGYELVPYARLDDRIVGEENTAPNGMTPWWVETPTLQMSHIDCYRDSRIVADIARKLRNEPGYTVGTPAPLPDKSRSGER